MVRSWKGFTQTGNRNKRKDTGESKGNVQAAAAYSKQKAVRNKAKAKATVRAQSVIISAVKKSQQDTFYKMNCEQCFKPRVVRLLNTANFLFKTTMSI